MRSSHWFRLACAVGLVVSLAGCPKHDEPNAAAVPATEPSDPFSRLTIAELSAKLADSHAGTLKLAVFDNNGLDTYKEGHIPGATWVQYDEIKASDLPADKGTMLVFYCYNEHCHASHIGARSAVKLGYSNVFVLPVGITGWKKAGKAIEKSG